MAESLLVPVVLSGGSGTRLWPVSREKHPKQLQPLLGGESLLQNTLRRLEGLPLAAPIVVSNQEYRFITAEQLRELGLPGWSLLLEPAGRNTAPALTAAALYSIRNGADPVLLATPADHHVRNAQAFCKAVLGGLAEAERGAVVTFGIVPDRPETGYGYIETASGAGSAADTPVDLLGFREKPDAATAAAYVAGGRHYWNSGIFMLRASVWLKAIGHLAPGILTACTAAVSAARDDGDFVRLDADAFAQIPRRFDRLRGDGEASRQQGIEHTVSRRSARRGWSDVGAWDALWQAIDRDADDNAVKGDVWLEDSHGNLVIAEHGLVACIGCEDMVVVETADAVLIAPKDRTQEVKRVVARLKAAGRSEADLHRKVHRPWGWYDSIDSGERFQVKRIVVRPGATLSLQMHHHRAEHWVVVRGTAKVTRGDETLLLAKNESTYIPLGVKHRLENPGQIPLEIIEVQSGSYLGEDDIVRFEDNYGRKQ
jgi:mannose-1-phosphate guanylyltransferase/mannose-6-phosphate isomerase